MPSGYLSEKEGFYQGMLPRTSTESNFSNILGGGTGVFSGAGNLNLTITGINVRDLGVRIGDEVYKSTTLVGTVTAIVSDDTVTVSSNQSPGFFHFARPSTIIEGDRLRGYYMTTKLTNSSTSFVELFAVNSKVINSRYHNT